MRNVKEPKKEFGMDYDKVRELIRCTECQTSYFKDKQKEENYDEEGNFTCTACLKEKEEVPKEMITLDDAEEISEYLIGV